MRQIDHVVLAVHDLDAAAAFYLSLGFQVGARNRHPWGTENRIIQFRTSFIELVTMGTTADDVPDHAPGRFNFGAFIRDYLHVRQGFAMLVLDSRDARADAALFARLGIGAFEPFSFERTARRPDGSATPVSFTLAFAQDIAAPDCGFFVCQHHAPEAFWNPAFQQHANGASAIAAVAVIAPYPDRHEAFMRAFCGVATQRSVDGRLSIGLQGGELIIGRPSDGSQAARFGALSIAQRDLAAQADRLRDAGIPFEAYEGELRVAASAGFGTAIRFVTGGLDPSG